MSNPALYNRVVDEPKPGFFVIRLVKKGPPVAARIDCVDGVWSATINGEPQEPVAEDPIKAAGVLRIWHGARPIDEGEYIYLLTNKEYAEAHDSSHPAANPSKPIDLRALPPVFK